MTWFDRSASPARRWWDLVARRHARRGSKIPEDDRSFFASCFAYLKSRGRHADGSGDRSQGDARFHLLLGTVVLRGACHRAALCADPLAAFSEESFRILRHVRSRLFFAARSDALVSPPLTLIRFNESRMPWVGIGARFELSGRELTPIHEISEDSRPYSIFGQRFMTTLRPAASAFPAAASSRAQRRIPTPCLASSN